MHLALVVTGGARAESGTTAAALAGAALDAGHTVSVFLAGDGTAHDGGLAGLRDRGARVVFCAADAAMRGWDRPGAPGRGSFVDLGAHAADADHLLVL